MYYFAQIGCAVAEIIFFTMVCDSFFTRRDCPRKSVIVSYTLFGAVSVGLSLWPELALARMAFWVAGGAVMIRRGYDAPLLRAALFCLGLIGLCCLADWAVSVLLPAPGAEELPLKERGEARVSYIIVCHLVYLVFVVILRLVRGLRSGRFKARILLPACPSIAVCMMFGCLLASEMSGRAELVALGLLYTSIVVILFAERLQQQEDVRHELELANHHYEMQKTYYEQLRAQQEQTRALWHDISKYLHAVEAEAAPSPSLTRLREMVSSITPVVDVSNRVVSVILNEYARLAKEAETALSLDIQIPPELPVIAADLYIILGNTIDNALEACAQLPRESRSVYIMMRMHNGMLYYKIRNPYPAGYVSRRQGRFHGYGLRNVRECAKRNHGSVQVNDGGQTYTVTVLINCG